MALWNRTSSVLPSGPQTDAAKHHAEAERIYREGLLNAPGSSSNVSTLSRPYSTNDIAFPENDIAFPETRKAMLAMRLRIPEGARFPFDCLETHWGEEKVFIFVVQDDKPVILEDPAELFPSDTLITQLRLIQK